METVKRIRTMRGMNQVDLAKASGVSQNTISEIETGRREARPATLGKLAKALNVEISAFFEEEDASPKAQRRSSLELRLFNGGEDERHLRYLRGWRAFVYGLERRWRESPPKTAAEISPLFDAMTALVEQGVFEPSDAGPAEAHELMLLKLGFQGLNDIADTVEKDEEAEQRRATFTLIQENIGA